MISMSAGDLSQLVVVGIKRRCPALASVGKAVPDLVWPEAGTMKDRSFELTANGPTEPTLSDFVPR